MVEVMVTSQVNFTLEEYYDRIRKRKLKYLFQRAKSYERNGGNLSYRMKAEEVEEVKAYLASDAEWKPIGISVPGLAGECFMVTGSGKHRVIYHAHTTNVIALTFVLPLKDEVFTRELWEMATECPVVFPSEIGVVEWMVPGGRDIAVATSRQMKEYDVAIWAHHGMFCSGEDFDLTFGLIHTVEKAAEILVKKLSMSLDKLQTITTQNFRDLAKDFNVNLPEKFLEL